MEPEYLGKYEIRSILGKGAMGTVYEAYDPVIARRVAIKTVVLPESDDAETSEDLARFRREAQAAGRLTHPNIVGVYDYGEIDRLAFIVMEFVEGITLKPALDKGERFSVPDVVRVMTALLDGLAYSHGNGVIHRDIKPANVMLTRDHKIKLTDFGVARIESSSLTQAGTMIGTPSYMSPEQFTGHPADARTDIYSAGVLLYQLLTGQKPFEGAITAIMHKVLTVDPVPPSALAPSVPPALDAVVLQAMAKQPEARFATAAKFALALNQAAGPAPESAPAPATPAPVQADREAHPEAPGETVARPSRRRGGVWLGGGIIVGAAVILALALSSLLRWPSSESPAGLPRIEGKAEAGKPLVFSLNGIKARVSAAASPVPCTLLRGEVTAQSARLAGLAGRAQMDSLRAALRPLPVPVDLAVARFSGPYCPALDTVRPYAAMFGAAADRLDLTLVNDRTTLVEGQLIMPQLRLPAFPAYLEVDYFSHDGSVFHLYPSPAAPLAVHPAADAVILGNPKTSGAGWVVGPPYGKDMILAVASSAPLFSADRVQTEADGTYLGALATALHRIRAAKGRIAVAAILLRTVPPSDAPRLDFGTGTAATGTPRQPPPQTGPAAPAR